MRKILTILGLISLAAVLFQVGRTLHAAGSFKKIFPIGSIDAQVIKGMVGAEDITIDRSINKALISADDRRGEKEHENGKGAIYLLDYEASPPTFHDLTQGLGLEDFHPHGLSLYHHKEDSTKWVFVVNHSNGGHFIEIFEFVDSALIHKESISDRKIVSPNDVVGYGKRAFYFTNDHGEAGGISRWKDFLMIGTGQLGQYDGTSVTILDDGLGYANGVNLTMDGRYVVVATTTDRAVLFYNRDSNKLIGKIACDTGLDNIEIEPNGSLLIGCHPKLLKFLSHAKDATNRSPSHIIRIDLDNDDFSNSKVSDVYMNNGDPLSGSSVAASTGNSILLGTVFEDGVLMINGE